MLGLASGFQGAAVQSRWHCARLISLKREIEERTALINIPRSLTADAEPPSRKGKLKAVNVGRIRRTVDGGRTPLTNPSEIRLSVGDF